MFISGKNVFLPIIINEENIKRIMKELVEKIAALVADFNKDANDRSKTVIKLLEHVHVRLHWKLKKQ